MGIMDSQVKFECEDSHLTAWGTSGFGDFISDMGVGDGDGKCSF